MATPLSDEGFAALVQTAKDYSDGELLAEIEEARFAFDSTVGRCQDRVLELNKMGLFDTELWFRMFEAMERLAVLRKEAATRCA